MKPINELDYTRLDWAIGKIKGWQVRRQPNGCWELTDPNGRPSSYRTNVRDLARFDDTAYSYTSDGFTPAWSSNFYEAMKLFAELPDARIHSASGQLILNGVPESGYSVFAFDLQYPASVLLVIARAWLTWKLGRYHVEDSDFVESLES